MESGVESSVEERFGELFNELKRALESKGVSFQNDRGVDTMFYVHVIDFDRTGDSRHVERNHKLTSVKHRLSVQLSFAGDNGKLAVASGTRWPWGAGNTGEKVGLASVRLEPGSAGASFVESLGRDRVPIESFLIKLTNHGVELNTGGPHGQFEYGVSLNSRTGKRGLQLSGGHVVDVPDDSVADDLERQLFAAIIEILEGLISEINAETDAGTDALFASRKKFLPRWFRAMFE